MSLNRTLVGAAGGVIAGLGTHGVLLSFLPAACQNAILDKLPDQQIIQICPRFRR